MSRSKRWRGRTAEEITAPLGKLLVKRLEELDLTQQDVCRALACNKSAFQRWLNGGGMRPAMRGRVARLLQLSTNDLLQAERYTGKHT